jgi:phosphate acetyltransferase
MEGYHMSKNLYITTIEAKSGKSLISLGIMDLLKGALQNVAFFRPIISSAGEAGEMDPDIQLIETHFNLQMDYDKTHAFTFTEAKGLINQDKYDQVIEEIMEKCKSLEKKYDFVLLEGTDFERVTSAFEFDINAEIAANLGAPVLLVARGDNKDIAETIASLNLARESFEEKECIILGMIITRVPVNKMDKFRAELIKQLKDYNGLVYVLPENETLGMLTMHEIQKALNGEVLYGGEQMMRHAHHHIVAAMQLRNFLQYITEGSLVITPGDRADIILGCLVSARSQAYPHIMGMVLTGGLKPEESVRKLIQDLATSFPIVSSIHDTLRTVAKINEIDSKILPSDHQKITTALATFEASVDLKVFREKIIHSKSEVVTPKMFEYELIQRARSRKMHIILPEGEEERILKATELLLRREVVDITLLGDEAKISEKIKLLDLKISGIRIINPATSDKLEHYAGVYFEARKHKGITMEMARDIMTDISYFGTMMVYAEDADAMVSGAVHTTQHTIRPAFEFIKTKIGYSIVSSIFFMCLDDRVLVYGDCAVNPNPNAMQLAEIAITSAETAQAFGIEPLVAMLSYSSGESGIGEDVERVREATKIAKARKPDLKIDGPIQYDAAIDESVAKTKMPGSQVAGKATVFIFPDLNTGNNTYKAVQRSANAVAIGPVLQGLNKPVNDLSRGCTVADIVNTVAITAIQAQYTK